MKTSKATDLLVNFISDLPTVAQCDLDEAASNIRISVATAAALASLTEDTSSEGLEEARERLGAALSDLARLYVAAERLLDATDAERFSDALDQAREMQLNLIRLLSAFTHPHGQQRAMRTLLLRGLGVSRMVEGALCGREDAGALLGHPDQTRICVRKLNREIDGVLARKA